jgi:hypothetical protein
MARVTTAMTAGVTDRLFDVEDIVPRRLESKKAA